MNDQPAHSPAPAAATTGIPAAAAAPVNQKVKTEETNEGSIKETIESILIAFILAFIFRGFVVEAFVIPTGSMAPTLLGAHMRFTCADCGYQFDTNFNINSGGGSSDDLDIPKTGGQHDQIICPNCGYHLPKSDPKDPAYNPFVRYGDRILVLKYLYLLKDPQRWDVVVFKSPDRPEVYDYTQNYIKRLIGKPGESIMILDGDIYAGPKGTPREQLKVQTKPREVQESLWRLIHDSDYRPRGVQRLNSPTYREPWTPRSGQSGWDLGPPDGVAAERMFKFNNLTGAAEIFFNDGVNIGQPRISAFNDWLAYDSEAGRGASRWNLVGDLKLQFFYDRKAGDGPLRLTLSKRGQNFVAEIGKTSARLLLAGADGQMQELIPAKEFSARNGPMSVEFSSADYQVTLRINDRNVLQTTPQQYAPNMSSLLANTGPDAPAPQVRISAENQQAALSHVSLWRDIYYLSEGKAEVRRNGRLTPEDFRGTADNIMQLGPDEFFTMGDNSQISGDGRYWSEPTILPYEGLNVEPGKVPARFMLGKAFFVYWPAGYRPFESSNVPAVVPNFGDMRFIH